MFWTEVAGASIGGDNMHVTIGENASGRSAVTTSREGGNMGGIAVGGCRYVGKDLLERTTRSCWQLRCLSVSINYTSRLYRRLQSAS